MPSVRNHNVNLIIQYFLNKNVYQHRNLLWIKLILTETSNVSLLRINKLSSTHNTYHLVWSTVNETITKETKHLNHKMSMKQNTNLELIKMVIPVFV